MPLFWTFFLNPSTPFEKLTVLSEKILASDEAWDSGQLGRDKEYAKPIKDEALENQIDESLGLQSISIRLQKSLIEDFKFIATLNGLGYQPLMRQVLTRFVDCEKKRILREKASEMRARIKLEKEQQQGKVQGAEGNR